MASDQFIELLQRNSVTTLVDIRTVPRSKHNPQFESKTIERSLRESGVDYVWMKGLGGLRRPLPDSKNTGWRNSSFRGFADHMQTEDFRESIDRLIRIASGRPTAMMCAEAVPWRYHRSLVADALVARGFEVLHILGRAPPRPHTLTKFALVIGEEITYPGASEN